MRCAFRWTLFLPALLLLIVPVFAADEKKPETKPAKPETKPETKPEPKPTTRDKDPDKDKYVTVGQYAGKLDKLEESGKYFTLRVTTKEPYINGRNIAYRDKVVPVPMQFAEGCLVRVLTPPPAFDDKGNPKRYTSKELRELRGGRPDYPADLTNLKNGQTVQVQVVKPKAAPRGKTTGKKDKSELDALAEQRPLVSVIVIIADPPPQ